MAEPQTPAPNQPDVDKILSTIRQIESGGNYGAKAKGSSASGAYQFINDTWQRSTKGAGVGTEYKTAGEAPPEVQDAVAAWAVKDILGKVGGDVTKVPLVWYTGNPQGRMTEEALKVNQGLRPDQYQQKWLSVFNRGQQVQPQAVAQAPRTTAQPVKVAQAAAPSLTDMPPSYRMALAANYLADTESPETSVVERAMEMINEQQGGARKNPLAGFTQALGEESINPFQFVQQPQEEERRRPVPRMPVRMAEGGEARTPDAQDQIKELYRQNLGREADTGGLEYWAKEFGPEVDIAERMRFLEGAQPEVQQRMAAGDTTLPAFMQVSPDVRRALQSSDLTTDQYKTLANYFGNQWIGGEAEDPASLTRRDYIERPRSGYDFATFLATRSQQHGAQADTGSRLSNLLMPYVGDVGQAQGMGDESNNRFVVNPFTGQTELASPTGAENIYRVNRAPHQGSIGDTGNRYAVGMDYRIDPQTGRAQFVAPYASSYTDTGHNDWQVPLGILGTAAGMYFFPGMDFSNMLARGAITLGTEGAKRMFNEGGEVVSRKDGSPEEGEVANPADIAEQMTVGTLPTDQKPAGQVFRDIGRDVVRGAQYLPYDLIGAPVDIATMAMRPFGYNVEKPFLGSEYLIDKAAQAGIANRPTGSAAETATRIGMGLVNPAAVARQIPKGIATVEKGVEQITLPAFRQITGNPSATKEEMMDFVLNQKNIMQAGAPAVVRPLGSAINTVREVNKLRGAAFEELNPLSTAEGASPAMANWSPKYSAVERIVIPKLENYLTRQFGTINDPLLEATISGKFLPKSFYKPNDVLAYHEESVAKVTKIPLKNGKTLTMEHINKLRELGADGNQEARKLLAKAYDSSTFSPGMYTQASLIDELKTPEVYSRANSYLGSILAGNEEALSSIIKRYISNKGVPDNSISYARKYDPNSTVPEEGVFTYIESALLNAKTEKAEKLIKEQAGQKPVLSDFVVSSKAKLDDWATTGSHGYTPQNIEELRRGKPVYVPGDPYGGSINYGDLADYMGKNPVEKWSKMSIPELVIASYVNPANVTKPSTIARYADEGIPLLPFQKLMGTKDFMPVKSQVLGNGAEWREITTREGLRIEGGLLKHCLKKDEFGYCNRLMNKESKYFTLRDADGQPYATIEMSKPIGQENQDVPFNVIKQVKGMSNDSVMPLYAEEVTDFLMAWQEQIGTKLRPAEQSKYLPPKFRQEEFGIKTPPENMARGGMVDKPLYDRAA